MIKMFLSEKNRCRRADDHVARGGSWFQDGLHDLRISTNVFPHAPVVVGIVELSAVNGPY